MAPRALAPMAAALVLSAGCGLGDAGPTAEQPPPPLVTHPSAPPEAGRHHDGGPAPGPPTPGERPPCLEAEDLTAAAPAAGHGAQRPVQVVPACSELEVPVPFTIPDHLPADPGPA